MATIDDAITQATTLLATLNAVKSGAPLPMPAPAPAPAPVPHVAPLPPQLAGKALIESAMPWGLYQRIFSNQAVDSITAWVISFKTPANDSMRGGRLVAGSMDGASQFRDAILFRKSDGAVLAVGARSISPIFYFQIGGAPDSWVTRLDQSTDYAFAVWNAPDNPAGPMYGDLYL